MNKVTLRSFTAEPGTELSVQEEQYIESRNSSDQPPTVVKEEKTIDTTIEACREKNRVYHTETPTPPSKEKRQSKILAHFRQLPAMPIPQGTSSLNGKDCKKSSTLLTSVGNENELQSTTRAVSRSLTKQIRDVTLPSNIPTDSSTEEGNTLSDNQEQVIFNQNNSAEGKEEPAITNVAVKDHLSLTSPARQDIPKAQVKIVSKFPLNLRRHHSDLPFNKIESPKIPSPTLSPSMPTTTSPQITALPSPKASQRMKVVDEIRDTEQKYLESLDILTKVYIQDLSNKKILSSIKEIDSLQSILGIIVSFNKMLYKKLKESDEVGKTFLSIVPFLKSYIDYFTCYEPFVAMVKTQKKENKKFNEWIKKTEAKCKSDGKFAMAMYLIMPIQRIPRYNLLLKELLKNTEEYHSDYENIKKALNSTVTVSSFLNEKVLETNNRKKFSKFCKELTIENTLIRAEIMKPYCKFIDDGHMQIIESSEVKIALNFLNQTKYFVFLTDMLIACEEEKREYENEAQEKVTEKKLSFLFYIPMDHLQQVKDIDQFSLHIDTQDNNHTLKCESTEERNKWIASLIKTIAVKEKKVEARTVNRAGADKWTNRKKHSSYTISKK